MTPRQRILLVEDEPDQAALFCAVLTSAGYTVITVPSAGAAYDAITLDAFDLAIVDWGLPALVGDAVITTLNTHHPATKTLLFSNYPHLETVALACGADAYLDKMAGNDHLCETVAQLLRPQTDDRRPVRLSAV